MEQLKAVIYIRVSDRSQLENNSFETQLNICMKFADDKNYQVIKVFKEDAKSAKHIHTRPEMRNMLDFCTVKKNQIAALIVLKMDRWTRNVEEGLIAISLLAKYGVAVMPATEPSEQNAMGKAMRTMLMVMAELDNDLKGERVRANMQTMFRNGYWCWKPRMGYKRKYKTKEENKGIPAIPDEKLSEIIKVIFLKAAEVETSKKYLAEYANKLGFKQYYGKKADGRTISRLIKDTFYYGYMYAPKWKEYEWGKHKPLVSQEIWERANTNIFGRKRKYRRQDNINYPLKGNLKCSSCSHPLTSSNPKGTSKNYLYYECHNAHCDKKMRIGLDVAHDEFIMLLKSIRPSERVLKIFSHLIFSEWDKNIDKRKQEAEMLEAQIKNFEAKLMAIVQSNSKGILTDEEAQLSAESVRKDIAVFRIERADIRMEQYDKEAVKGFVEDFLVHIDKLWMHLALPHKQALQDEIFPGGLVAEKGKIRIVSLASTFKLIHALEDDNVALVTPREVESRLPE